MTTEANEQAARQPLETEASLPQLENATSPQCSSPFCSTVTPSIRLESRAHGESTWSPTAPHSLFHTSHIPGLPPSKLSLFKHRCVAAIKRPAWDSHEASLRMGTDCQEQRCRASSPKPVPPNPTDTTRGLKRRKYPETPRGLRRGRGGALRSRTDREVFRDLSNQHPKPSALESRDSEVLS